MKKGTVLKCCPFCGAKPSNSFYYGPHSEKRYSVFCPSWNCTGGNPNTFGSRLEIAIKRWNTRIDKSHFAEG